MRELEREKCVRENVVGAQCEGILKLEREREREREREEEVEDSFLVELSTQVWKQRFLFVLSLSLSDCR